MSSDAIATKKKDTIGGFDKWEIESAFDTLVRAKEILGDDKKVDAIRLYADERVKATEEVADQLNLEKTVGKKLKSVFKK